MKVYELSLYQILLNYDVDTVYRLLDELKSLKRRIANQIDAYKIYCEQLNQIINNNIDFEFLKEHPISIAEIYRKYDEIAFYNSSHLFFNNHLVMLYPNIKLYKTTKPITCNFSGEIINKGREYLYYRPMLEDLTTEKTYIVTPTIKVSPYYEEYLPKDINELEIFHQKLSGSYDNYDEDINYYDISCNLKSDGFILKQLKKMP